MVSICLCILWGLLVAMLLPNQQPAGIIVSAIGALLISVICNEMGVN